MTERAAKMLTDPKCVVLAPGQSVSDTIGGPEEKPQTS